MIPTNTTFYDIIQAVSWDALETSLCSHYNVSEEDFINSHLKVYNRLKMLEPVSSKMVIKISEFEEDDEKSIHVTGEDGTRNRDMPDFKYMGIPDNDPRADELVGFALEFQPWQEWLGMKIHPDTLKQYPPEDIASHCLWELTFIGFEEDKIQARSEEIKKTVEDIKSGKCELKSFNNVQELIEDLRRKDDQEENCQD